MSIISVIVFFLTECILTMLGWAAASVISPDFGTSRSRFVVSMVMSAIGTTLTAYALALLSVFSLRNILLCLAGGCVILLGYLCVRNKRLEIGRWSKELLAGMNYAGLLIVLAAMVLYLCFPTSYLWARRDPALYTTDGIQIAETGNTNYESNQYITEHYDEIKDFTELTYRGFTSDYLEGNSDDPGKSTFQFLHMYPAILAVGYALLGLKGLNLVTPCLAVLCLLAIYYFTKSFFSRRIATFVSLLTLVNPAQLWSARITQTEILFQLIFIAGIWFLTYGLSMDRKRFCIAGASLIGMLGFIRIDAYLIGFGLLLSCIVLICFELDMKRNLIIVSVIYLLFAALNILSTLSFAPYYFWSHWNAGYLNIMFLGMGVIVAVEFVVALLPTRKWRLLNKLSLRAISENRTLSAVMILGIALAIYLAYFIRPLFQTGKNVDLDFNKRALVEFCWYCTVLSIPFFMVSLTKTLRDYNRLRLLFPFLAIGMVSTVVYVYKPGVAPDHIWASRRWVSTCLVFVTVFACEGIEWVALRFEARLQAKFGEGDAKRRYYKRAFSLVAVGCIAICLLLRCRLFIFQPMLQGMEEGYELLNEQLDSDTVYYAELSHYANYLYHLYHKNVIVFNPEGTKALRAYLQNGHDSIYYIGSTDEIFNDKFSVEQLYEGEIYGTYLVQKNGVYPTTTYTAGAKTNLYKVSLNTDDAKDE